jgi:hypothetical protein
VSEYKIIKGGPLPTPYGQKYPWPDMDVGDSFEAPAISRGTISSAATLDGRKYGRKWSIRKIDENTIRVWRIS